MINFDILEKIREAQRLAEIEQIKANAIVINKNFVKTPKLYVYNKGTVSVLPPMICGLEMYFTDNELPDNYSFAILDAGQTERDRLVSDTRYETAKEILSERLSRMKELKAVFENPLYDYRGDKAHQEHLVATIDIEIQGIKNLAERYGVEVE